MRKRVNYEISRIEEMNLKELHSEYLQMLGRAAPSDTTRGLLRRMLTYEVRLKARGGFSIEQQKLISQTIKEPAPKSNRIWDCQTQFKPGTRLRRLWKGKTYQVICEGDGFNLEGVAYKSLSEVARNITGTRWNGYVFFGLKSARARRIERAAA